MRIPALFTLALLLATPTLAQRPPKSAAPDTLEAPLRELPVTDATALGVDQEGNLLLLSTALGRLCKRYARFDYDSTYCIGGPGVGGDGFAQPTELQVVNRQELYVLDANNRRLVVLSVDLGVLREIDFEETPLRTPDPEPARYINPMAFAVGGTGELYVLSAEDNAVYKFDLYGRFERRFGGLDYGEGRLVRPNALVVTSDQTVYVADTAAQAVSVYDKYGVFQFRLLPSLAQRWRALRAVGRHLLFAHAHSLTLYDVDRQRTRAWHVPGPPLHDAQWRGGALYLLRPGRVSLHRLPLGD